MGFIFQFSAALAVFFMRPFVAHQLNAAWNYTTVTGYFLQDNPSTNASSFDFRATNFGLINRTYPGLAGPNGHQTQWQRFMRLVANLQNDAPKHVNYKVLFLGRHGEGYHNAAEAYYGTPAWNCYYSILNGNATVTWSDALLTPTGRAQALANHEFWASEIRQQKTPTPWSFYTSPLTRCLQSANLTFSGLDLEHPFVPTVKEFLREGISGHTCDRRRSKAYIHDSFPKYRFEKGFAENDPLFQPLHNEPRVDQNIRSKKVLDDIFEHDKGTYLSITSHSGEISSILEVIGHRPFSLSTGATIPVLIKANRSRLSVSPSPSSQPYPGICTCTSPPPKTVTASECTTATAFVPPPGGGNM